MEWCRPDDSSHLLLDFYPPPSPPPPLPPRRQVVACVATGKLKDHQLEKKLGDHARAVAVRRKLFERRIGRSMENLPVEVCVYIQKHVSVCAFTA